MNKSVRNSAQLNKVDVSLDWIICGIPHQASHMGGDNDDVEGRLPSKKSHQAHFNRDTAQGDSLDYSNHVNNCKI